MTPSSQSFCPPLKASEFPGFALSCCPLRSNDASDRVCILLEPREVPRLVLAWMVDFSWFGGGCLRW
ncbi:hypothetical protein BGX38DRAFT_1205616 [Terfezia claveryi]|nr:hypothetical protein BGX38DRAFT_1205616 [Terfezia claveryi]